MLREDFKLLFQEDDIPSETAFDTLLDQTPLILATTADLPTAAAGNLGQVYLLEVSTISVQIRVQAYTNGRI